MYILVKYVCVHICMYVYVCTYVLLSMLNAIFMYMFSKIAFMVQEGVLSL